MTTTTEDRKTLEPLASVVSIVLRLLLGLTTAGLLLSLYRGSWGSRVVCIANETNTLSVPIDGFGSPESGAGADAIARYCADDPGAGLRFLNELGSIPTTLLLLSSLFLLHRLLQGAARDGIYTHRTASGLRLLGWWLLVGSLVVEAAEVTARTALLADLAKPVDFTADIWLELWSTPYLAVFTALGLLTFARITRAGVTMREDLEGVV
ncbi:hypothetical protein [Streptomyces sp. NPDC046909]|uniref:hypothetical protein n=1 Tax=Streptomyces sp. NPDC046909 TaxID=3155617 RepID=UPI0033EA574D